ncbi:homeobox domain-containing protein KNAG_0C01625 [Huiozyma naganishii CBS 8797]|uniref:Homeobox domain-containing protein n=1 Tax=Huiozyma naganishii (strain ATCC MYA-139 / BCRC 22969 / CBS 8797 / KCTC 17520 / NBRC 10181 / NCYC 3082 / Yp74L-3) TaxID=1071383 RepID=J7S5P2_HUIN7|nr:hypothetical protein KNAG_0C01625 [Kazachstania naganishii CBS 8797]CCK69276.1 hypothetical protein KNAG_0C01625 [Kazachstania naganishii CBS 8797]
MSAWLLRIDKMDTVLCFFLPFSALSPMNRLGMLSVRILLSGSIAPFLLLTQRIQFQEILVSGLNVPEKKGLLKDLYETYSTIIEQKNRPVISRRTRLFLEKVFTKKQWLTKEERQLIARKCGISPLQVRIWFINKRARSK